MSDYLYLAIPLCMLVTAIFAIRFVYDVLKAAWCASRGKEIRWKVFEIFTHNNDWKSILIWGAAVCVGVYGFLQVGSSMARSEYEEPEIKCASCATFFPEQYGIWGFDGDRVCPRCAQTQIHEQIQDQQSMKESVETNGEYIPDIDYLEDYLVVEKSECNWCGNYAPSDLYDQNGERICIDCITEALQNDKVARAIWNYIENG